MCVRDLTDSQVEVGFSLDPPPQQASRKVQSVCNCLSGRKCVVLPFAGKRRKTTISHSVLWAVSFQVSGGMSRNRNPVPTLHRPTSPHPTPHTTCFPRYYVSSRGTDLDSLKKQDRFSAFFYVRTFRDVKVDIAWWPFIYFISLYKKIFLCVKYVCTIIYIYMILSESCLFKKFWLFWLWNSEKLLVNRRNVNLFPFFFLKKKFWHSKHYPNIPFVCEVVQTLLRQTHTSFERLLLLW